MNLAIKKNWVDSIVAYDKEKTDNGGKKNKKCTVKLRLSDSMMSVDGILCDMYLKQHGLNWGMDDSCLGSTHSIPKEVKEWAELDRYDPLLPSYKNKYSNINGFKLMTLGLISSLGSKREGDISVALSYTEIADLINKDL